MGFFLGFVDSARLTREAELISGSTEDLRLKVLSPDLIVICLVSCVKVLAFMPAMNKKLDAI